MERIGSQGNHAANRQATINENLMAFVETSNLRRERQAKAKARYETC